MNTKLTLTVEKQIIEKAKTYAKNTGRSLSDIVESFLESIVSDSDTNVSDKLKNIVGAVKLPKNFDEKKELQKYYESKHLK